MEKIYNVSLLNQYIKNLIEGDFKLANILVVGEICNLNKHYTGHYYFSIKDENSKISCMMFSFNVNKLESEFNNGDQVLIKGYVSVYDKNGTYQLYVQTMEPYGKGKELLKLEELKKKLKDEGLFDLPKKEIPKFPQNIGIVTSKSGAAVKDIIHSIQNRYNPQIYVFPCLVQGENAPKSIIDSLIKADEYNLDTIIIARGGGANEDLSAFNDEQLVRFVASLKTPIITAIGHQIDSSILDLVSDCSCITPTEAGLKAVPNKIELNQYILSRRAYLNLLMNKTLISYNNRLLQINSSKGLINPFDKYQNLINDIDQLRLKLNINLNNKLNVYLNNHKNLSDKLRVLNPYLLLNKGYSLSYKGEDIVTSVQQVNENDLIKINLKDGTILAKVVSIKKGE